MYTSLINVDFKRKICIHWMYLVLPKHMIWSNYTWLKIMNLNTIILDYCKINPRHTLHLPVQFIPQVSRFFQFKTFGLSALLPFYKVGCALLMVVVSLLPTQFKDQLESLFVSTLENIDNSIGWTSMPTKLWILRFLGKQRHGEKWLPSCDSLIWF